MTRAQAWETWAAAPPLDVAIPIQNVVSRIAFLNIFFLLFDAMNLLHNNSVSNVNGTFKVVLGWTFNLPLFLQKI
jgi:hypothetical protein